MAEPVTEPQTTLAPRPELDSSEPQPTLDSPEPQATLAPSPELEPYRVGTSEEAPPDVADRKRKHEDIEGDVGEIGTEAGVDELANVAGDSIEVVYEKVEREIDGDDEGEAKRQRVDDVSVRLVSDGDQDVQSNETSVLANGQVTSEMYSGQPPINEFEKSGDDVQHDEETPSNEKQPNSDLSVTSHKIEIPNSRVGVLIGKGGETIRYLQYNSGTKIQIAQDDGSDPHTGVRQVELIGTPDNIKKAEQMIKDVMAEADAGGAPALLARGLGTFLSAAEQLELKVPMEKVGMIIGKGGGTIKNLQIQSGARIQLIPQHLPEGDSSKERTVRISGNTKQIEAAADMIREVMNQGPGKLSPLTRSHSQHAHHPGRPTVPQQWGTRPPMQPGIGYDNQQRGSYPPPQGPHHPQSYGGYPPHQQQLPHRGKPGAVWEQRPTQSPSQTAGYNYYRPGQGGPPMDIQQSAPPSISGPAPASATNYYGQPQSSGYSQGYVQSNYGQGYGEPRYDTQTSTQQVYGQPPVNAQPAQYHQQVGPQAGYQQQTYNNPGYGGAPQVQSQSYGPPTGNPADPMYQGSYQGQNPPQNYASGVSQQQYPYGSGVPQAYGGTPGAQDGYGQQPSGGYPQYGGQVATGYAQPGQAAPAYPQSGQAGYGQYQQPQQQVYAEQPVQGNGYQGAPANAGYGAPTPGYGVPPAAGGYAQAPANPTGYDQSVVSQSGYAAPPSGPVATQPLPQPQPQAQQPGYVQYDSTQAQVYQA